MSLTSEEVNFLIYRYLLESGFLHSAFLFGHESTVLRSDIDGSAVPPGALISFLQKGLQYTEIEAHVSEDGTELQCGEPFSVLHSHVCRSNNKKRIFDPSGEVLDEDYGNLEAAYDQIIQLKGHVVACTRVAWNTAKDTVAAGAFDGSVRVWEIVGRENRAGSNAKIRAIPEPIRVLMAPLPADSEEKHESKLANGSSKSEQKHSVTDLEWNASGSLLAAGFMDGRVFVWTAAGEPKTLPQSRHAAPVVAVRWASGSDSRLLSASIDGNVFIWDLDTLERKANFALSKAPILDASWRNENSFVTSSADGSVILSSLESTDVKRFAGHENDANKVVFDSSRSLFATASDDVTVKVWSTDSEKPVHTFTDHTREVIALAWSPVNNPSLAKSESGEKKPRILASSSYDCTIVIYDVDAGSKLLTINRPTHPVTVLKFSPNGEYLASVSNDRLFVWNIKDGSLARTFKATDGISDCSWDGNSSRVSTVASDGTCAVVAMK